MGNLNTMKSIKKLLFNLLLLVLFTFSAYTFAQENEDASKKYISELTAKQLQLLKEQQVLIDKAKVIFKENLTQEQLATLNDRSISKDQRAKFLKQSLSLKQRKIISTNRELLRTKRVDFRKSLSKQQKVKLRQFIHDRKIDDRRRLVRRLRRLIRDNITDRQ